MRSRKVAIVGLTNLGSLTAYQLLYRSTDSRDKPIATVTTLLLPTNPAPGPRKLVSYQPAEDSLTTRCSPSYTLRTNSGLTQPSENGLIATALANGWDVVVPDYEGPGSHLAIGQISGRTTLDSIRAVSSFGPSGLDGARTPVGLMGYSGGSIPTLWAGALAKDYAPELNLVAVASGGVLADFGAIMRAHAGPPFFGIVLGGSVSLDRAYPDTHFRSLLNDHGKQLADQIGSDARGCGSALTGGLVDSVTTATRYPDIDSLLAVPSVARSLTKVNLVAGPRFSAPTLIVQGVQDELAPVGQVDAVVGANCGRGVPIDYQRIPGEHATTLPLFVASGFPFLSDRFAGRPAANTC